MYFCKKKTTFANIVSQLCARYKKYTYSRNFCDFSICSGYKLPSVSHLPDSVWQEKVLLTEDTPFRAHLAEHRVEPVRAGQLSATS